MSKILVEVYVPVLQKTFDLYIPLKPQLYEIEPLIMRVIQDMTDSYFSDTTSTVLCNRETGEVLNINLSPLELSLVNGTRLMII